MNKYFIEMTELIDLIYNPFKFRKVMKTYKIKDFHKARALNFNHLCEIVLNSLKKYDKKDFQNKNLIDQNTALSFIKHYLGIMDPTFIITTDNIASR